MFSKNLLAFFSLYFFLLASSKAYFLNLYKEEDFQGSVVRTEISDSPKLCYCLNMNGFKSAHWDLYTGGMLLTGWKPLKLTFFTDNACSGNHADWHPYESWGSQPNWFGDNQGGEHRTMKSVYLEFSTGAVTLDSASSFVEDIASGNTCVNDWAGGSTRDKKKVLAGNLPYAFPTCKLDHCYSRDEATCVYRPSICGLGRGKRYSIAKNPGAEFPQI